MSRHLILALLPCLLSLTACGGSSSALPGAASGSSSASAAQASANRYVVGFAPGVSAAQMQGVTRGLAQRPDHSYHVSFNGFAGPLTAAEHGALARDSRIAFIEPDLVFTACGKPPKPPKPGDETPPPETLPWGVDRIDADHNTGDGGAGVAVAVIDTGIDLDHPDLIGNVFDGANFVRDGNPAEDDNGHGTHVAGIIAAVDNEIGVIGVAPQAKVYAVKVLDRRGSGSLSDVIAGVDWVTANAEAKGFKVANMSLTARGDSIGLATAINKATLAGVTIVAAAGNYVADAFYYIPAKYDNVICVSALDKSDYFAYFSNYGQVVDLIAPGVNVPSLYKNGGYKTLSGTSMAAPHVAGAAALWLDNHLTDDFYDVYDALVAAGEFYKPNGYPVPWPGDTDGIAEPLVDAEDL